LTSHCPRTAPAKAGGCSDPAATTDLEGHRAGPVAPAGDAGLGAGPEKSPKWQDQRLFTFLDGR